MTRPIAVRFTCHLLFHVAMGNPAIEKYANRDNSQQRGNYTPEKAGLGCLARKPITDFDQCAPGNTIFLLHHNQSSSLAQGRWHHTKQMSRFFFSVRTPSSLVQNCNDNYFSYHFHVLNKNHHYQFSVLVLACIALSFHGIVFSCWQNITFFCVRAFEVS